jgi:hypothetical protein
MYIHNWVHVCIYIYILYMLSVFIPGIIWDDSPYHQSNDVAM